MVRKPVQGHRTRRQGEAGRESRGRPTLGEMLANDTTYDLSVLIGRRAYDWGGPNFVYDVQLLAGNTILASGNPLALAVDTFATHMPTYDSGVANPDAGQLLKIRLVAPVSNEVFFDDVTLSSSSGPEPGSVVLMTLGLGACCLRRRTKVAS